MSFHIPSFYTNHHIKIGIRYKLSLNTSDKLVRDRQNTELTAFGMQDPVNQSLLKCFPTLKYLR